MLKTTVSASVATLALAFIPALSGQTTPQRPNTYVAYPQSATTGPTVDFPTASRNIGADQTPTTTQDLINHANDVLRELQNDPRTAHENIHVVPENGKISLRGVVSSSAAKSRAEEDANYAAKGTFVASFLTVQKQ